MRQHLRALEESFRGDLDALATRFDRQRFSAGYLARSTEAERREKLRAARAAAASAGGATVEAHEARFVLTLEGEHATVVEFTVEEGEPWRIDSLEVRQTTEEVPAVELSRDNLATTFEHLEKEGYSGVVHVRLGGEVVLERPFGMANTALGAPVRLDTVFGTGSRPIDYTKAAVFLLEQRGRLHQDDTIDAFFDAAPADKRAMTLRHLMTGRSGLPDFFDTEDDWDPDLAWIDRTEAERRILALPLLFAPGEDRRHSHAAFGLLAAIIERVSGQSYEAFLRASFFDPAGMNRTGMYGDSMGLSLEDFAVGGGPSVVGLPNIPPNWGPTSWLVMGSGGMYSTLPDLRRFYALVRSGDVLEERYAAIFRGAFASLDGSDRGFELFHVHRPPGNEAYLMINLPGPFFRPLIRALRRLVESGR